MVDGGSHPVSFDHATPDNIAHLVHALPGLPASVARAWLACESQEIDNPTNPLNILYSGHRTQTGKRGRFATYTSPEAGLDDAAWLIANLSYYTHVRAALGGSPIVIAHAIEDSPWAGGHYGRAKGRDGCVSRAVRKAHAPVEPPAVRRYRVQRGDTLQSIAGRLWHDTSLWPSIYAIAANRAVIGPDPNTLHPGQVLTIPRKPRG